jgi:hypothetical protein
MPRWVMPVALAIVFGVAGVFAGRAAPTALLRTTGQYDLMEGVALIGMANAALHGRPPGRVDAMTWGNQGIAYLQASTVPLGDLGLADAAPVYRIVMPAEYDIISGHATERDRSIVQVFERELKPFANVNWGSIPDSQLEAALQRIVTRVNALDP